MESGNSFLMIMTGDLSGKSKSLCPNEIISFEVSSLDFLPSQFGLSQIKKEPTHIRENSKSCKDFIFTSQPNVIIDSSVHASLRSYVYSDQIKRIIGLFDLESTLDNLDANDAIVA